MSWSTFRERWSVFVGAIITVCIGVALVQSSLLTLVNAATAPVPANLAGSEARAVREGYEAAIGLLGLTLGLATFVAVFIVSSTFAFTVAQRRRDLALLRLTGASRRQLRALLLGEAMLLGLVGSGLGVVAGLPVMRLQAWMLVDFGFAPSGFVGQWRCWVLAVSFGTGVTIAVCGVLAASARASRVRPLEALREIGAAARVMTVSRWIVGMIFLAGSTALVILVPALGGEAALAMSTLISTLLVVAFAAFAPLIVPLVSWLLRLVSPGRLGQLAHANLRSGVRRSASTAAPIMVLVAFVAGTAGTFDTMGEAARQETTRTLLGDLIVTSDRPVMAELAAVDGVGTVSEEVPVEFALRVDRGDGEVSYEPTDGVAADPAAYMQMHRVDVTSGDLADLHGDTIAVSPSSLQNWRIGATVTARFGDQTRDLRVVALLAPTIIGPYFLLAPEAAPDADGPRRYVIGLADGAAAATVAGRLATLGDVVTTAEWIRRSAEENQRTSINIIVVLLGMAMVYTVIAMVNAVVISASDRRGEFAIARVTGLTRSQVVRMALWESVVVVAIGLLLGGLAAATTVLGVATAVNDIIGTFVVIVRWPLIGALALGAAVIVGVSTVLTTLSATQTPPIRLVGVRE